MTRLKPLLPLILASLAMPPADPPAGAHRLRFRDFFPQAIIADGNRAESNGPTWQGRTAIVDLPPTEHLKNKVGTDGQGLCVWTSLEIASRWDYDQRLQGLRDLLTHERGGGWPDRVASKLPQVDPDIQFVQYQGTDPAILDLAMRTHRAVGVTYGYGENYHNQTIAHMVVLAHLDKRWAAIIDNNFPGEWTWMPRQEFLKRWCWPHNQGWAVVLLNDPPPPYREQEKLGDMPNRQMRTRGSITR